MFCFQGDREEGQSVLLHQVSQVTLILNHQYAIVAYFGMSCSEPQLPRMASAFMLIAGESSRAPAVVSQFCLNLLAPLHKGIQGVKGAGEAACVCSRHGQMGGEVPCKARSWASLECACAQVCKELLGGKDGFEMH